MTDFEIKQKILQTISEKYSNSLRFLKPKLTKQLLGDKSYKQIYDKISKDLHYSHTLVLYCFLNDILSHPICECGNKLKFNTTTKQFYKYCSTTCKWNNNENIQDKKRNTCNEKYGSINVLSSDYGKTKSKLTILQKYGVDNYTKTEEYKNLAKTRKHSLETKEKMAETHRISFYNSLPTRYSHCSPLFTLNEFEGVKGYKQYKWRCNTCNNEFESSCDNGSSPICRFCKPKGTKHEQLLKTFIESLGENPIHNWRGLPSKREIDLYIPSQNIGFEICGLYWHSTANYNYNKVNHISKHEECEKEGIRLITIFDDEIYNKKTLVLNRVKNSLNKIQRKIYARKCNIIDIDSMTCERFLNKYHIQGSIYGKYKYGLIYKNRLVAVMTFNKGRYATGHNQYENVYELGRFCTVSNFKILGGASKLFNHFIKTVRPSKIYSYSDNRWNSGKIYNTIGMTFVKNTVPNYFYTKNFIERLNRLQYQKSNLKNLPSYDSSLTEEEIMKREKFFRIYDCGSKLFEWTAIS